MGGSVPRGASKVVTSSAAAASCRRRRRGRALLRFWGKMSVMRIGHRPRRGPIWLGSRPSARAGSVGTQAAVARALLRSRRRGGAGSCSPALAQVGSPSVLSVNQGSPKLASSGSGCGGSARGEVGFRSLLLPGIRIEPQLLRVLSPSFSIISKRNKRGSKVYRKCIERVLNVDRTCIGSAPTFTNNGFYTDHR
jgi:hypothetical protein